MTHGIQALLGLTLTEVDGAAGDDEITFTSSDGRRFRMHHAQDCCERVDVESIIGDLADLIGSPILHAEESTSDNQHPEGFTPAPYTVDASYTWTFYKLATVKGWVDIRWFGTSNGYYSESVDFEEIK